MERNLTAIKKEIIEVGRRIYQNGFTASNDGNISARIEQDRVLITPTGVSKGFMKVDDLIIVDMNGNFIEGSGKPSSETGMHVGIYADRPDVNSVCHTHPPYATGFAVAGIPLDKMILQEVVVTLGKIPIVEYATTGTADLYKNISGYIKKYDALLLANHGAVTVGSDVFNAYNKMETLEHSAKIQFIAHQLGNINTLNENQVEKLMSVREKFGIRKDLGL